MNVAAKTSAPILRNAAGEPPLGIGGLAFRDDQGCMFEHDNPRYRSPAARIIIFELDNGKWLAGSRVDGPQFDSREKALRYAIAEVVRRARRYAQNGTGEGTHWEHGYAGRVIEWALSIKPEKKGLVQATSGGGDAECDHPVSGAAASEGAKVIEDSPREHSGSLNQPSDGTWCDTMTDKMANEELTIAGYEASDAGAGLSDPVVKYLVEQHGLRKQFPAKHIFSMTAEVVDGRIVSVATCTCKQVFKFGSNDYLRTNAAIEAHWRRFSHEKTVDGRGQSIGEAAPAAKPKKSRKKSQPGAGGHPAPIIAEAGPQGLLRSEPAPEPAPLGAGSLLSDQAAPIGAGMIASDMAAEPADDWSPMLNAALDLAWREPPKVTESLAALLDFGKVYGLGRKVERPVLRWHGGKWRLAPWIISHFPPHKVYIEPFGGAGSVLMQKLPVESEVWNDLEGEAVNLFRVLRSSTEDLARAIYLTPFSREEYHSLYEVSADPIERARRFVARSFMGQLSKGALRKSGFDSRINPDGFASRLNALRAMPDEFHAVAERFRSVIIEQRPADAIFAQYDRPDALFYVDPPYLSDRAKHYNHELDEAGHAALLQALRSLAGMVVVSGYRSDLYDEALADWRRVETEAHADGGIDRTEVLWINPACADALDVQHPALFDLAAHDVANTPPTDMSEADA